MRGAGVGISRRAIGKAMLAAGAGVVAGAPPRLARAMVRAALGPRDDTAAERLGWRLGCQAWTFRDRTCIEAVETAGRLGLRTIELYPGQALAPNDASKVGPGLGAGAVERLRGTLDRAGVRAACFGVTEPSADEKEARAHLGFCARLGIETMTCEPEPGAWAMLARLAEETGVRLACHNHPRPSRYWEPEAVLRAIKDLGSRVGFCADVGHWLRSGLTPVECLERCEGRLVSLHLKDTLVRSETDKPDVVFGTGGCGMEAMLGELKRQGFRGVLSIEYETGSGATLEREVAESIRVFDAVAARLAE
ncbi:MAG: sugar phosphate isomerase/epimerase [Phycisphaerae bacterium]|nr:sugar phosphate isomerase/epimerase [Phycisphaerae bacterium]